VYDVSDDREGMGAMKSWKRLVRSAVQCSAVQCSVVYNVLKQEVDRSGITR
jgi:hypothetical protein